MIASWIAIALLSASWLWGLGYFQPPGPGPFLAMVALAVGLLAAGPRLELPSRRAALVSAGLLAPSLLVLGWPWSLGPWLLLLAMALAAAPPVRGWLHRLAGGALAAGMVMLIQAGVLSAYVVQTARSHDLPSVLAWPASGVAWLLGLDATLQSGDLVFHTLQEVHRLALTWELLIDPASLCLTAGGLVWLGLLVLAPPGEGRKLPGDWSRRWLTWLRGARTLVLAMAGWSIVRMGLMIGLYFHRAVQSPADMLPTTAEQFLSHRLMLLLLLPAAALLAWLLRDFPGALSQGPEIEAAATSGDEQEATEANAKHNAGARPAPAPDTGWRTAGVGLAAIGLAVAVVVFAIRWNPPGGPRGGRVMVVERHSTWEPTTRPYDTTFFGHDSGYNYAAIYDYASHWFTMSRLLESDAIDEPTLSKCDVLILKTPTSRMLPEEVDAIEAFVRDGGGLLLVGDHTNVFNCSTYLNDVARRFDFCFRNDLLFRPGSAYQQNYRRSTVPHPTVQYLPPMDFAVSCSVDPGRSWGRAAIRNWRLWNLPPDYHAENYHPHAEYRPEMRYGAFVQLWSTRAGSGRVLAFTDSTIFSNFCVFQPGKAELFLGMLHWLNRSSMLDAAWLRLAFWLLASVAAAALAWFGARRLRNTGVPWPLVVSAALAGLAVGAGGVVGAQRRAMPELPPERPFFQVVIDRTVSDQPLSKGAFTQGDHQGFGLLEQWIGRLGYFTTRRRGPEAFSGDMLVVICPTQSVSDDYRRRLVDYVAGGGKLLVIDSPDSYGSTANSLLWPFGLVMNHATDHEGALQLADGWPGIELQGSCEVIGGKPFIWLDDMPVGALARHGDGMVMAIGFGGLFRDAFMGYNWMTDPDADLLERFNLLFALVRGLGEGREPTTWQPAVAAETPETPKPSEASPKGEESDAAVRSGVNGS
jgi:hypothetical protein